MSEATVAAGPVAPEPVSKRRRVVRIVSWIVGLVLLLIVLNLLGVNVRDWLKELWDSVKSISVVYIVLGCIFQCLQTVLTALGWYGILRYAYPGGVTYMPVLAAYATGVALNNFLPANIGTFVTLLMYVAIVQGANFPGVLAGYVVQKIFYFIIGTLIYVYLFLAVAGSFNFQFGNEKDAITSHVVLTIGIVARRDLPDRHPPPDLLELGEEDVGQGEAGRRDPRRPRRVREVGAPAADGRVRGEGDGDHRLPRRVQHPGHVRLGDERPRLEPAREHPLAHPGRRGHQPGVQRLRARQLHELDERRRRTRSRSS